MNKLSDLIHYDNEEISLINRSDTKENIKKFEDEIDRWSESPKLCINKSEVEDIKLILETFNIGYIVEIIIKIHEIINTGRM